MLEENGMNNIILWMGNLFAAGTLFFYASMNGMGGFAQRSGRQYGKKVNLWIALDRLLEFAVYSAGMIQLVDLIIKEIADGEESGWMLPSVRLLFIEGMLVMFLVLSILYTERGKQGNLRGYGEPEIQRGLEDYGKEGVLGGFGVRGKSGVQIRLSDYGNAGVRRKTEILRDAGNLENREHLESGECGRNHGLGTIMKEEGESILAMLLLLVISLMKNPVANPWKSLGRLLLQLMILFLLIYLKKKRRERQSGDWQGEFTIRQQRQADYLKSVDIQYQRTRELWHDLKNHIGVLEILAKEERFSELTDYLNSFKRDVEIRMIPAKTGNTAVDALLSDKLYYARKSDIEVSIQICNLSEMLISAIDLCAVLGNLLDNAIEACGKFPEKGRIVLRLRRQENFYYLTVVNTAVEPERENAGFVSGKRGYENGVGHGLGLRSVERIAHQYGGSVVADYSDGEFKVVVRLQEELQ